MSEPSSTPFRTLACRDLGFPCEWQLRAASIDEVQRRFREHARCAHGMAELDAGWVDRVTAASRPA